MLVKFSHRATINTTTKVMVVAIRTLEASKISINKTITNSNMTSIMKISTLLLSMLNQHQSCVIQLESTMNWKHILNPKKKHLR